MPLEILFSKVLDAASKRTSWSLAPSSLSWLITVPAPTKASVVEDEVVTATVPATPTAPKPRPTGAKFISSLVTAAIERPLAFCVSKLKATCVKLSSLELLSWSRVDFVTMLDELLSTVPVAASRPEP